MNYLLFNDAMIRALLDGSKTQDRRIIEPKTVALIDDTAGENSDPVTIHYGPLPDEDNENPVTEWYVYLNDYPDEGAIGLGQCPYGSPGSLLLVRECFIASLGVGGVDDRGEPINVIYRADDGPNERSAGPWSPSIHMPRWASRLTLRLTEVRVQRVQDISEDDARAEGVEPPEKERFDEHADFRICPQCGGTRLYTAGSMAGAFPDTDCARCDTCAKRFRHLFDSIYEPRGYGWDADPWVWALTFELIRANIDSID